MNTSKQICLLAIVMLVSPLLSADQAKVGLAEWSDNCVPGFKLSAMPSHWQFNPEVTELTIVTNVAIDFLALPEDSYEYVNDGRYGDEFYFNLSGYTFMVLQADIRSEATVIRTLAGVYRVDRGKEPVVFVWDGNDAEGKSVAPGFFEIDIRGRFVPKWTGLQPGDGFTYRDFDDWMAVDEACYRTLSVEVVEEIRDPELNRGVPPCALPDPTYYDSVDVANAGTLRGTLHPIIDDHTLFPYSSTSVDTWDVLNDADEDPLDASQLLTVYKNEANANGCSSGCAWNREHTWAKSYGFSVESGNGRIPYTDCHHLRAADPGYNSTRSNKPFEVCDGCTEYPTDFNSGFGGGIDDVNLGSGGATSCGSTPTTSNRWEPWDHRKGDVARTILYMDVRYEGDEGAAGPEQDLIVTSDLSLMMVETTSVTCPGSNDGYQDPAYHGVLSTLLAWNLADPVDADEIRRNDEVWCHQGNRNPFVDHPEWIPCLYQNQCVGPFFAGISDAIDLDPCAITGVQVNWNTPSSWNDGCDTSCSRGYFVYRDGAKITTGGCGVALGDGATTCVDTTGVAGMSYNYSVESFNHLAEVSDGGVTKAQTDLTDDGLGPQITVPPSSVASQNSFTASWTTNELATSYLTWGTSPGTYPDSLVDQAFVTGHSLKATGLFPLTTFYYLVCSADQCGNPATCSAEAEVTTLDDPGADAPVYINELHYDNVSGDTAEGVEIVGPAGTDLTGWSIAVYNGNGGGLSGNMDPNPVALSGTIGDEGDGVGALWFAIAGIENGPDGVALVSDVGTVVQFWCYEGIFAATAGPATGIVCIDMDVVETGTTPTTHSLQLSGGPGCTSADFTWIAPSTSSHGLINAGQTIACDLGAIFSDGFETGGISNWSAP